MTARCTSRPPESRVYLDDEIVVDSFAGGGGASKGIELALGRGPDIAINHDAEAIALHAANHPETEHYQEDVWKVDPVAACRGRRVGLMWLSPDCKHFSKAKGGKPVSKRVRGLAWVAVRWAVAVKPRIIVLENVEEFQTWGPLLGDRPDPARKGHTFKRFVGRLRNLGYIVEWRELRACDYGAPTIRKRLFLIARCDGQPIAWPTPTHGKGRAHPWRTAAECIDFSIECPSIFTRKKALADNTLKRIGAGLRRFVFEADRPFIVSYYGQKRPGDDRVADLVHPLPTQTTENRFGLVQAFVVPTAHHGDARVHALTEPLRTITGGKRGDHAVVEPFLVPMQHENRPTSAEEPLQTITTQGNKFNLVAPVLVSRYGEDPYRNSRAGQPPRARSVETPMQTVVPTGNGASLVAGFLAKHYGGHETPGTRCDLPISTLTTQDHHHLVTAHIQRDFGQSVGHPANVPLATVTSDGGGHSALVASSLVSLRGTTPSHLHGDAVDAPMRTVAAGGLHAAEVRAFLVAFYGTQQRTGDLLTPMATVTSKDRLGLVTVEGVDYQLADIGMRMLQPRELFRAQGFDDSYIIDIEFRGKPMSKTAQVRMCGNSVCPDVAAAIIRANAPQSLTRERVA